MNRQADREYWQLIWEKFKMGERKAFETIYNEFVDVLFAYGSKITSDRAMLEDCIQDMFVDIYNYGSSLRQPEYLEYYLFKTLKRIIFRKLKEKNRFDFSETSLEHFNLKFSIEENETENENREEKLILLQKEIKNLNAKKRELLFLKFNSGLTYTEMGELLELKPDTVKKQVHRLLKYFRSQIGQSSFNLLLICFKT